MLRLTNGSCGSSPFNWKSCAKGSISER
jgi:hypothetical protein